MSQTLFDLKFIIFLNYVYQPKKHSKGENNTTRIQKHPHAHKPHTQIDWSSIRGIRHKLTKQEQFEMM